MPSNLYHSAALLDESLTTVKASFQSSTSGSYTFLIEKDLAATLEVGDIVVVQKVDGAFSICKLWEINEESDVDLDADFARYSFVIGRVNTEVALRLNKKLDDTVAEFKKLQRSHLRNKVKAELLVSFDGAK